MTVQQPLPRRYIDKQKLANFWRSHPDFKGKPCKLEQLDDESYVVTVPRKMTDGEIKSTYYDKETLEKMEAGADAA
ncbi:hypothetical protein HYALB_00007915 [Hymenoscyphus albidus]|uniref:Uncharacterized protein n=1 Tax=Hymenoscyphus albidus TaxID=595503 RepID=A0A9N9Q6R7_9HELO|nr:hypothetical protein HYALB_00007915 [Hymenoscyphus albidus]